MRALDAGVVSVDRFKQVIQGQDLLELEKIANVVEKATGLDAGGLFDLLEGVMWER